MVNPVNSGGVQAYAYQTNVIPPNDPRGGENRVEQRQAPAPDTQKGSQRDLASRDDARRPDNDDDRSPRGRNLDVVV